MHNCGSKFMIANIYYNFLGEKIGSLYLMFEDILIKYLSLMDTRRTEFQILTVSGLVMVICILSLLVEKGK